MVRRPSMARERTTRRGDAGRLGYMDELQQLQGKIITGRCSSRASGSGMGWS